MMASKLDEAEWKLDCLNSRMDAISAVERDGRSALSQLEYIVSAYKEEFELEGNSAANKVLLRNKNDIQRWVAAAKKAGKTVPALFSQNTMWK